MHARNAQLISIGNFDDDLARVGDADLIVEAIVERLDLKQALFAKLEQLAAPHAVIASNTSTLPITGLAEAVPDQGRFIGLHFFSPVPKMKLVEIIRGAKTSDATLARAYDYVLQVWV